MTHTLDLSTAVWRESSYSGGGANDCVEVAGQQGSGRSPPGLRSGFLEGVRRGRQRRVARPGPGRKASVALYPFRVFAVREEQR
ncbi:DUF397 domain-containing protein [Streptomyces sp. B21-083]|uniref:DUF397 domain-containing protein n=1 Tax=Streptomyces sp. B21-083 TaxID=3039410 RepID=UPI003FA6C251